MGKKENTTKGISGPSNSRPSEHNNDVKPPDPGFPIVGIGASAGGLAAIETFFAQMPSDARCGMAFVLVQHLAPDHKSILTDLVKRYTRMGVYEVEDGMEVRPNCTYIIPPNRDLALLSGRLNLTKPSEPRGLRLPIDLFFRSLAQDQRERAIGIVLSGTGSDGTSGIKAIKGEGGLVMAQDPESTEYDGMPRSAIATGLVDYVLPPGEMPARLIAYAELAIKKGGLPVLSPTDSSAAFLQKILILLRTETGHDFSQYKPNTVGRRVERRMAVNQIEQMTDYVQYLQKTPEEIKALFRDLLIGVTNFFRDPEAFQILKEQVVPHLLSKKRTYDALRVWVPGCSTGEEAYSLAILFKEHLEELRQNTKIQIFATDIDSQAIEQARTGVFPPGIASDISPDRLTRFFIQESEDGLFRIQKNIRDMLVFSEQDLIKDPPFSKQDLVSCRNLLIYMDGDLQKKVISLFHYALNPNGYLFLGSSETVGDSGDSFFTVDRKWKIYRRNIGLSTRPVMNQPQLPLSDEQATSDRAGPCREKGPTNIRDLTERTLLRYFAPVGAVVTNKGDILYIHGRSGKYLEPATGEASTNILRMAREGLERALATALRKAVTTQESVFYPRVRVRSNGDITIVNLTIRPIGERGAGEPNLFLITFEELPLEKKGGKETVGEDAPTEVDLDSDRQVAELKRDLQAKEDYIQAALEELETSNEELKSTNEELQSANEELQSTNEELETSKEELQSVNEELTTVNVELQTKVEELSRTSNDMNNLLAGTGVGTIFVDHHLRIKRFTPAAVQVINLIPSDVGRPVSHIVSNLIGYVCLVEDVQAVIDTLIPKEKEVQTQNGAWYLMRIRPYRTLENAIEGVVLTFVDITEQKRIQESLRESESLLRLAVVVRDSNDAIMVTGFDGRILAWNPGAENLYGYSEAEALSMNLTDLIPENEKVGTLEMLQKMVVEKKIDQIQGQRITKDGTILEMTLTASVLLNRDRQPYAVALTEKLM